MAKFYVTTAIDYVNARPHIGHAYEKIVADVLARWHRLLGDDVFFLTGTDENAQKNAQAAQEAKIEVRTFVNKNSLAFRQLCDKLTVSYDDFIKTTEARHVKVAQYIFTELARTGDIYKGIYEGLYCTGCEAYYNEKELVDGKCPEHNKAPTHIKQESYFFKMSKYQDKVLNLLQSGSFVLPEGKCLEITNRIKTEGLKDLCVSRYDASWGIDVPIDKKHKIYVWIDALSNYISALGYPGGAKFKKYWPADVHLIGKGINWFHSVIWPALLFALKVKQPKLILVHGYLTVEGRKMSKSSGATIDPAALVEKYGVDALRYFLLREIPLWQDGDYSEQSLKNRLNNELNNDLGNLASRVLTLTEKHFPELKKVTVDSSLSKSFDLDAIKKHIAAFELHNALTEIWAFVHAANRYVNEQKPWECTGAVLQKQLYTLLEALRILAIILQPFIPSTTDKLNTQLGVKPGTLKDCTFGKIASYKVKKGDNLFQKVS